MSVWVDETDPLDDLRWWAVRMSSRYLDPVEPHVPVVHPRFAPWIPPQPKRVPGYIARLLPAPRPPAEIARQHALLNPTRRKS